MRWGRLLAVAAIAVALLLVASFGAARLVESDDDGAPPSRVGRDAVLGGPERGGHEGGGGMPGDGRVSGGGNGSGGGAGPGGVAEGGAEDRGSETVKRARCRAGIPECAETEGRILYVEAVDPDGDGDAHFVVLDGQSISLPGLTAIDVRKGLRPDPLPGPGDLVSAAGPVQTGSYGQSQIHALEFNVAQ